MRDSIDSFSRDELVQAAKDHGLRKFSVEKLHGWLKMGLLRTPPMRSLGRGLGRPAAYPPETLAHLLMISELLGKKRNVDVVRWRLFLAGLAVPMKRLRQQFEKELARYQANSDQTRVAFEAEDDDLAQRYLDGLSARVRKSARKPSVQILRTRIDPVPIAELLEIVEKLAAGLYEVMSPADASLLARAMGFQATRKVNSKLDPSDAEWLAAAFSAEAMRAALDASTEETLLEARSEFVRLTAMAKQLGDVLPELGPTVELLAQRDPYWPPPLLFLLWLRNRDDLRVQQAARDFLKHLRLRFPVAAP